MKDAMIKRLNDLYTELEYEVDEKMRKIIKLEIKTIENKLEEER